MFMLLTFQPPAVIVVLKSVLTNMQQQNALFHWKPYVTMFLPHESDICYVTRFAAPLLAMGISYFMIRCGVAT